VLSTCPTLRLCRVCHLLGIPIAEVAREQFQLCTSLSRLISLQFRYVHWDFVPNSRFGGERAMLLTEHMKIWKYLLFLNTSAALVLAIHNLLGLVLASWSFFIASPFRTSPQLAAVVATFSATVLAILGLVLRSSSTALLFVCPIIFTCVLHPRSQCNMRLWKSSNPYQRRQGWPRYGYRSSSFIDSCTGMWSAYWHLMLRIIYFVSIGWYLPLAVLCCPTRKLVWNIRPRVAFFIGVLEEKKEPEYS